MNVIEFIKESNAIEGIHRPPNDQEINTTLIFLELFAPTISDLCNFVKACEPTAELRDRPGLDVRVGGHFPPKGNIAIRTRLEDILRDANSSTHDPHTIHTRYEILHPFTDCNGRSGRILWLWMMHQQRLPIAPLGFLQTFYYQTLSAARV